MTMFRNLNLVLNFESIRLVFCLKVFIGILFESIRLVFCSKVFVCYFISKYPFAIFLKVFVCYFVFTTIVDVSVIFAIMDTRNYEL